MISFWIRFISKLQGSGVLLTLFGVREPRKLAYQKPLSFSTPVTGETVWFHAASVGELEMLRALIDDFAARGHQVGVTCFSDSALKALDSVREKTVYAALSPKETDWEKLFRHFNVKKLIVSKYDVWPGMAMAAAKRGIPVVVINARLGGGLKFLRLLFQISSQRLPRFFFFSARQRDAALLRGYSQSAPISLSVDPRFERVARRIEAQDKKTQVQAWGEKLKALPKSYGIVGSAWIEDLERLVPAIRDSRDSIMVVPHDLTPDHVAKMRAYLDRQIPGRFVLVDQMGLLVELYALANWVFVGGGYGKGIHSTLEPSAYAVPIACGPKKVSDFPETEELIESSVLTVCQDEDSIRIWHQSLSSTVRSFPSLNQKRDRYRSLLEECIRIR